MHLPYIPSPQARNLYKKLQGGVQAGDQAGPFCPLLSVPATSLLSTLKDVSGPSRWEQHAAVCMSSGPSAGLCAVPVPGAR